MTEWKEALYWACWFSRIDGQKRFVYRSEKYGWVWRFAAER